MNKNIPPRVLGYKFIVKSSLISSGKGKSVFSNEVTLSTTPGEVTCSVVVQHTMDSKAFVCFY